MKFVRDDKGNFHFVGETFIKAGKDSPAALVTRWRSVSPIVVPDGGVEKLEFDGVREVLDDPIALRYVGPPITYAEHFEFKGGQSLAGTYRGIIDGTPAGTPGDMVLDVPPR
jgi:hypothetical protein